MTTGAGHQPTLRLAQRCRASAAVAAILAFAAAPAAAVDWEANHFVSTRLALTNSDGLSSSNDDGFGTSLRGTIGSNLRGTGRRLNFAADTTLSLITRSSDGTPEIDQNIRALSTLELWKNRVLVDATAVRGALVRGLSSAPTLQREITRIAAL